MLTVARRQANADAAQASWDAERIITDALHRLEVEELRYLPLFRDLEAWAILRNARKHLIATLIVTCHHHPKWEYSETHCEACALKAAI